jgi:arabinose-5-phosphate isomerase
MSSIAHPHETAHPSGNAHIMTDRLDSQEVHVWKSEEHMSEGSAHMSGRILVEELDDAVLMDVGRSVIRGDRAALAMVEDELGAEFVATVRLLRHVRGKVLVTGMGTSGATARRIAHLLSCGGTAALFVHAADGLHGGLGAVERGDCLIAISKGGESDELNDYCRRAKVRGASLVAMTAEASSTLAQLADQVLLVVTPPESDPGDMMAMGSAIGACAVGDALAVALMRLRGYPWERFESSHPGGAVGKRIEARG